MTFMKSNTDIQDMEARNNAREEPGFKWTCQPNCFEVYDYDNVQFWTAGSITWVSPNQHSEEETLTVVIITLAWKQGMGVEDYVSKEHNDKFPMFLDESDEHSLCVLLERALNHLNNLQPRTDCQP